MKSRTVCGHTLTFRSQTEVVASRTLLDSSRRTYPISIRERSHPVGPALAVIAGLSYEDSNRFLRAFNNRAFGFMGRRW